MTYSVVIKKDNKDIRTIEVDESVEDDFDVVIFDKKTYKKNLMLDIIRERETKYYIDVIKIRMKNASIPYIFNNKEIGDFTKEVFDSEINFINELKDEVDKKIDL